jgi:hypothetical protein
MADRSFRFNAQRIDLQCVTDLWVNCQVNAAMHSMKILEYCLLPCLLTEWCSSQIRRDFQLLQLLGLPELIETFIQFVTPEKQATATAKTGSLFPGWAFSCILFLPFPYPYLVTCRRNSDSTLCWCWIDSRGREQLYMWKAELVKLDRRFWGVNWCQVTGHRS